ncbi:hypothetical protein FYK55_16060 [Roseiconus nitratireducens]|uniref:Uncharacterized protein n=1 Tax=Roseiconus nitratireducens TaxID=2605748 RepID=A0A5M6D2Q2_9BACT|nr:hypothetical protein [Roseiconus nitratireducens]KAA5541741.1 hypothetical protein FYK55_16060 [Roseiconus nitratireducens]
MPISVTRVCSLLSAVDFADLMRWAFQFAVLIGVALAIAVVFRLHEWWMHFFQQQLAPRLLIWIERAGSDRRRDPSSAEAAPTGRIKLRRQLRRYFLAGLIGLMIGGSLGLAACLASSELWARLFSDPSPRTGDPIDHWASGITQAIGFVLVTGILALTGLQCGLHVASRMRCDR